jgi:hypothetical protein
MKKRIITALLFIIITSALLFFYLLNEPAPTDKNFTGGEAITSRFIYVNGSQGWNQKVNYRNKYKVALGNMLTTKMEKSIINSIKSDISSITNGKNWPKEGYEIKLSNIRLIDDGYDLSAVEFDAVVDQVKRRYHIKVVLNKNPNTIDIKTINYNKN